MGIVLVGEANKSLPMFLKNLIQNLFWFDHTLIRNYCERDV